MTYIGLTIVAGLICGAFAPAAYWVYYLRKRRKQYLKD